MGIEGRRPRPRLADELVQALSGVNEAHGRSLAKALGADSGAVARALVRLERKGTVSSHWAGRTRLYRLRGSRTRRVEPLLREAIERLQLVNDPRPLAILPFGSRATGQGRPDSDLDLIVIVPDGKTDYGSWERLSEAVRGLRVPVDLIVYSQTQARRWARLPANPLRDAREDLLVVQLGASNAMVPEGIFGFHAQQATEKALKALVAAKSRKPQRTHNLRYLADVVRDLYELRADPLGGQNLTLWGTTYRYPGAEPPAEPLDRAAILEQVERCIGLANRLLKQGKSKKR